MATSYHGSLLHQSGVWPVLSLRQAERAAARYGDAIGTIYPSARDRCAGKQERGSRIIFVKHFVVDEASGCRCLLRPSHPSPAR
jgi:hypothetical protein